jgi:predicted porin
MYAITGSGTSKSPTATVNDIKNTQYGVRYNLSKRTMAYFYSGVSKDSVPLAAGTVDKISKGTFNGLGLTHAF